MFLKPQPIFKRIFILTTFLNLMWRFTSDLSFSLINFLIKCRAYAKKLHPAPSRTRDRSQNRYVFMFAAHALLSFGVTCEPVSFNSLVHSTNLLRADRIFSDIHNLNRAALLEKICNRFSIPALTAKFPELLKRLR